MVEKTKANYYASLRASSEGWHDGRHSLEPWWDYFLGLALAAHREFAERVSTLGKRSKSERVRLAIDQLPDVFSIAEVERLCPGVSRPTIRLVMQSLRSKGAIRVLNRGKNAKWQRSKKEGDDGV